MNPLLILGLLFLAAGSKTKKKKRDQIDGSLEETIFGPGLAKRYGGEYGATAASIYDTLSPAEKRAVLASSSFGTSEVIRAVRRNGLF